MKKLLTTMTMLLALGQSAFAQFGNCTPSERYEYKDKQTGVTIIGLTDTTKNDRFMYQTDPMWTPDGKYLLFRSSSRGDGKEQETVGRDGKKRKYRPTNYFFIDLETGKIIQATDGKEGGVFLGNKSNKFYYNRREDGKWSLYEMNLDAFFADVKAGKCKKQKNYERFIGTFPAEMGRPGGMAINSDDTYAFISVERDGTEEEKERMNKNAFIPLSDQPIKIKPVLSGLRKMNLQTGEVTKIADVEFKVGHIQSSRFNPDEIVFCNETGGDAAQRMWYAKSDGSVVKPLYKETPLDWVTHETFASRDYVYFNILGFQPRLRKQASGILRINLRNDDVELLGQVEMRADGDQLRGRGFWHCNATRDDKWSAGDTFAGSVWLINNETGQRHHIATETRMRPDHSHPAFSPDCKKMIFQSGHFTNGKRLNLMMVDLTKQAFWEK